MTKVEDILRDIRPEFDFTHSEDFFEDGMLDSFDMVTLVSDLDKSYGISIAGADILPENFSSISRIEQLLRKYVS